MSRTFLLQVVEANDDIGNLYARVVYIVLNFHETAAVSQHADEGIAQDRVPKMSNVRSLIRIDIGVFDYNFVGPL